MNGLIFANGIPNVLEHHEAIPCTNDRAWEIFAEKGNEADGSVVTADYQTKGRGRQGRTWNAEPGASLLMSVIFIPPPSFNLRLLPLAVGTSAARALKKYKNVEAKIKWPNDIVFEGKKLGGVLVESKSHGSELLGVVIGMGINVRGAASGLPEEVRDFATTLDEASGLDCSPKELLFYLVDDLRESFNLVLSNPKKFNSELSALMAHEFGEKIKFISGNETYEGRFLNVGADGELILETENGKRRFVQGEIVRIKEGG